MKSLLEVQQIASFAQTTPNIAARPVQYLNNILEQATPSRNVRTR